MKKIIIGIFFLSVGVNAQDIKGGFKFSPNFSTFSKDVENESKGNIGFGLGYFETMDLNSKFALSGEINYTNYSYETGKATDYVSTTKHKFNFIEVPVILKYKINNFALGFGVQYGFGMGGNTTQTQYNQTTKTDMTPSNDKGFLIDVSTKTDKFNFGLRYYLGAEKIYDGNSIRSINLSVGYIVF